jgi:RHS repeat-associated protein
VDNAPRTKVAEVRDSTGRTVRYQYDSSERLIAVTDPAGGVTRYGYDSQHRMTTITDARGITFLENTYDANSRVCRQRQADNGVFTMHYVTADIATTPESVQLLQEAEAGGPISQAPCMAAASSSAVVATVLVDPRGHPTTHRFNGFGVLIEVTDALGQTTTYERDAATNLLLATIDALGRRTTYRYNAAGNMTSVTRLAGTSEAVTGTFTYEGTFNQVTSATDPLGHTTTFAYDTQGNLTRIADPLGHETAVTPSATGQPAAITDALGNTMQFAYNGGDLVSITDPLGNTTTRTVDSAGRVSAVGNPLGQLTRSSYDALNRLSGLTDARGGATWFGYDPNGNLTRLMDAQGHATAYTYDVMDQVATRTDPLGRAETYGYDLAGNMATVTDRKGQLSTTTYDALNRRTQVTYADGSTTSYTWDAGNRVVQIVDSLSGTITRTYDSLDRLTQETTPQGTVSYTYDTAGRRTGMTVAGQPAVTYAYDNADRLTQITQGTQVVSFTHDAANRRTSLTLPNGVVTEYAYDAASRLTGLTYRNGAGVLGTLTYGYDAAGNRMVVGGTWARTGLPPALAATTYDAANQQLAFGASTLTYDLNGNLTSDGTTTYTWDARNRLAGLSGPNMTTTFQYDALGRRTRKTINGIAIDFLYDGLNPVQELAGAVPVANLLTGLSIDEFFTRTDAAGPLAFPTDALQSTLGLADVSGTVGTEYTYEPFGMTTVGGPPADNAFQYTGRENDGTGLYYYRARYYHPGLQRFISEDPMVFAGGDVNLYAYVGNSPVNFIDPLGERGFMPRPSTGGMRGPRPRSTPMRETPPPPFRPKPAPLAPELVPQWEQAPWWMRILKAINDIADALQGNPPTPKTLIPPTLDGRKNPCRPPSMYEELFVYPNIQRGCI